MPYRFRKRDSMTAGVRRIMREEIDKAVAELRSVAAGHAKGLHEARKRIKKLRSLIRLFKSRLDDSAARAVTLLTDASRPLSGLRDAQAMVEAFDKLIPARTSTTDGRPFAAVRDALVQRSATAHQHADHLTELTARPIELLHEVRAMSQAWTIRPAGFGAMAGGLRRAYRRSRDAMQHAYAAPHDERFHEWRKQVKNHWHHHRLLRTVWPRTMIASAFELGALSDLLGDDHDLAVLRELVIGEALPGDFDRTGLLLRIDDRRQELRRAAHSLGKRLFAERPKAMVRRLREYWNAWRTEEQPDAAVTLNVISVNDVSNASVVPPL